MEGKTHPRLRTHKRKGKQGQIWTWWTYDNRGRGGPEIPLGSDYEKAVALWWKCEQGIYPASRGDLKKLPKIRKQGARRNLKSDVWHEYPKWAKVMYFNAERRASGSGRLFNITPAYFLGVVDQANGKCSISGIEFDNATRSPFAASLDRIDSGMGYEPGNIRLVCHALNVAMNTWGLEPVLLLASKLLQTRQLKNADVASASDITG